MEKQTVYVVVKKDSPWECEVFSSLKEAEFFEKKILCSYKYMILKTTLCNTGLEGLQSAYNKKIENINRDFFDEVNKFKPKED